MGDAAYTEARAFLAAAAHPAPQGGANWRAIWRGCHAAATGDDGVDGIHGGGGSGRGRGRRVGRLGMDEKGRDEAEACVSSGLQLLDRVYAN